MARKRRRGVPNRMLISICIAIGLAGDTTYNRRVRYFIWLGLGQALGRLEASLGCLWDVLGRRGDIFIRK